MEFRLIDRIRARLNPGPDVVLGLGDDAAVLRPRAGQLLVAACDVLNELVHFAADDPPDAIGHKSAAVNLSDLAAMGAEPAWALLGLSLPEADADWLEGFLDGFLGLAGQHGLQLVGGDTTRGPRSISVSVMGWVPEGAALTRSGARIGDDIWVSGTLGDAAAALDGGGTGDDATWLRDRLCRPTPRVALGCALRGIAHAAIDVSDGLLADLGHVLAASAVGASVDVDALPTSPALRSCGIDATRRRTWQCTGGDDYELLFSAPAADRGRIESVATQQAVALTCIGRIEPERGMRLIDAQGAPVETPQRGGWQHFEEQHVEGQR